MMKFLIINGPNMNAVGSREPELYGDLPFSAFINEMIDHSKSIGVELEYFQSNHEGAIIDKFYEAEENGINGIILNPAAYTHTSIAIADAVAAVCIPVVEVHMTNLADREEFRRVSYVSRQCIGTISGFSLHSYTIALGALHSYIEIMEGEEPDKALNLFSYSSAEKSAGEKGSTKKGSQKKTDLN